MRAPLLQRLRDRWIPPSEVRAEAWALGGRYAGEVVRGARAELAKPGLPLRRSIVLRLVIQRALSEGAA